MHFYHSSAIDVKDFSSYFAANAPLLPNRISPSRLKVWFFAIQNFCRTVTQVTALHALLISTTQKGNTMKLFTIAELDAAFLASEFSISTPEKKNHASYIANWLKVLKDNKQFIISAASEASKAVEYMKEMQPLRF